MNQNEWDKIKDMCPDPEEGMSLESLNNSKKQGFSGRKWSGRASRTKWPHKGRLVIPGGKDRTFQVEGTAHTGGWRPDRTCQV